MANILWLDMEMTGLEVENERIIEVAAIVTDWNFETLATYEAVVQQPQEFIDRMDDWNKTHHGASGLIAKIPNGKSILAVEDELLDLLSKHFTEPILLAGNSIGQDRLFINSYMPALAAKLHYRMLDVTSWKLVFQNKYKLHHAKKGSHRALSDIEESISELKYYLSHISAAAK